MARTLSEIQNAIITDFQAQPELAAANSNSNRAIWRLFTYVQAAAILVLEQLMDVFKTDIETEISQSIPTTAPWITSSVYKFQYSTTNPQIINLVNLVPTYPVIDPTLQIVTRCSVTSTLSNRVLIKVAKNNPPEQLSSLEVSSLQDYINTIGSCGIQYNVTSTASDKISIEADVNYIGQYSSMIQTNVINAIKNYLANLPFNGEFKISELELIILNVTGVTDILFKNIKVRPDNLTYSDGLFLIQNKTYISKSFQTISGYITEENTSGYDFSTTLNFIANV